MWKISIQRIILTFMKLKELDKFLRDKLVLDDFSFDASLNGIQIASSDKEIKKIGYAVDASLATIKKAAEAGCDMLFVHHGLFWGDSIRIDGPHYDRVKTCLDNDMALYACHLPLDAHPVFGNNAQMAQCLGIKSYDMFSDYKGKKIGVKGKLPFPMTIDQIVRLLDFSPDTGLKTLEFGKDLCETVGIVSGGAGNDVADAINDGLDLFITGEIYHQNFHEALENKINVIAGGHYQSETFGVKAVMRMVLGELGIKGEFISWPTAL